MIAVFNLTCRTCTNLKLCFGFQKIWFFFFDWFMQGISLKNDVNSRDHAKRWLTFCSRFSRIFLAKVMKEASMLTLSLQDTSKWVRSKCSAICEHWLILIARCWPYIFTLCPLSESTILSADSHLFPAKTVITCGEAFCNINYVTGGNLKCIEQDLFYVLKPICNMIERF